MTETNKAIADLIAAKRGFKAVLKDTKGYGYKYATLDQIIHMAEQALNPNNWTHYQDCWSEIESDSPALVTCCQTHLVHASGHLISSSVMRLPVEPRKGLSEAQAAGINWTYMRRYQVSGMFGIAAEEDTDACKDKDDTGPKKAQSKSPTSKDVAEAKRDLETSALDGVVALQEAARSVPIAIKRAMGADYYKQLMSRAEAADNRDDLIGTEPPMGDNE